MADFAISDLPAPTGTLQRARLYDPDGGTVVDLALTESPAGSGTFGGTVAVPGTPDDGNYSYAVKEVAAQSAGGYDAGTTYTVTRGHYGYLRDGNWLPAQAALSVTDHFTTQARVERFAGPLNTAVYADKDGEADVDVIAAAWEQALADTDNEIVAAFRTLLRNSGVDDWTDYDLVPGEVADAVDAAWLAETADWGATVRLYGGRGQADGGTSAGESPDGKMEVLWQRYQKRLQEIRDGLALLATAEDAGVTLGEEWGEAAAPVAVYPTVDRDGRPATASNVGYGVRWDPNARGYRWDL